MKAQICCKDETICAGLSVQDDIQRFYLLVCFRCKRGVEVSLRLGLAHVLTVHPTVIHCVRATSLRRPYKSCFESIAKSNLHFL